MLRDEHTQNSQSQEVVFFSQWFTTMAEENVKPEDFKIIWLNVCNCVQHEMYPKIASTIKSFINHQNDEKQDNEEKSLIDLDIDMEAKLIKFLKTKRKLPIEERTYLKHLIQRARSFKSINKNSISLVTINILRLATKHGKTCIYSKSKSPK